eukprot:5062886-Pyramimonas_sp.AAC.1
MPLVYKLFSRLLYNRLQPTPGSHQTADQACFRPGHSTTDYLPFIARARKLMGPKPLGRSTWLQKSFRFG